MRGENIFSVSILFFILLFFSKEEEECCQTEKKRDSIDVQEWGGAAQLVTPITVSQRDVFFSPHQKEAEEPSDLLLFFFFFFSTFFLCISWLSLLPTYLYLGL
jgi:ABC-type Na+ efflux pump permease subunit